MLYTQSFKLKTIIRLSFFIFIFKSMACFAGAPAYVMNLDRQRIPLSSLKGSWVFINYWASWCDPCVEEIVQFNKLYAKHEAEHIQVFGVNQDGVGIDRQNKLATKFGLNYPSLDPQTMQELHLRALSVVPVTYVLNPLGELHTILYGGQTLKDFNEAMKSASDQK